MTRWIFAIQSHGISMDSDNSFVSNLPEIYIQLGNFLSSYNIFLAWFLSWKDLAINAFFRAFQTSYEKATFGAKYKEMPEGLYSTKSKVEARPRGTISYPLSL